MTSQRTRSQELNRADALERFAELLSEALHREPPRIPTRVTRAAKIKRVEEKKKRTEIKEARSKKGLGRLMNDIEASLLRLAFSQPALLWVVTGIPSSAPVGRPHVPLPAPFERIAYSLSMSRPATHLFEVTMDMTAPAGNVPATVDLQMPLWQPGRYSVADFAENVQEFSAKAGNQKPCRSERPTIRHGRCRREATGHFQFPTKCTAMIFPARSRNWI